jgi:DNA/RNA endonuclease YhcR with UshA esterase domain
MSDTQKPDFLPEGDGIICPSCARYVGAYERCPHCQAVVHKRLPIFYIKRFAIFGTIIGLILMWVAAVRREVPLLKIGEIKPQHNMALIRCVGKVTGVRFMEDKNSFHLKVDDDTGMLSLSGFDKLRKFRAFYGAGFPAEGDLIEVVGNLSISEKFGESMFVSDPRRLKIIKKFEAEPATIENINLDSRGAVFRVRVKVAAIRKYRIGNNITVKDDTGSMDLNLFDSDREKIPDPKIREELLEVGNEFDIVALVDAYKGKPNLKIHHPDRPESVKRLAAKVEAAKKPEIPQVKAVEVRDERVREVVTVAGRVTGLKEFQFGTSIDVTDDSGTVNVWLREHVRKELPAGLIKEGAVLVVTGEVGKFKDRLQVLPAAAADLKAEASGAAKPAPEPVVPAKRPTNPLTPDPSPAPSPSVSPVPAQSPVSTELSGSAQGSKMAPSPASAPASDAGQNASGTRK